MSPVAVPRVLLPAAMTLAAGLLIGWAAGNRSAGAERQEIPDDLLAWERAVTTALELRPEQRSDLRNLLYVYHGERQRLLHRHLAEAGDDWADLDRRFESILQTRILDPGQQARATALAEPAKVAAGPPPR